MRGVCPVADQERLRLHGLQLSWVAAGTRQPCDCFLVLYSVTE